MSLEKMRGTGQIFSGEFFLAYVLFTAAFGMVLYLWNADVRDINDAERLYGMESLAVDLTEQLIRTGGFPTEWNFSNVVSIGLADESRILNSSKIISFVVMMNNSRYDNLCNDSSLTNYECEKHFLGVRNFEFSANLTYLNDTTVVISNTSCFTGKSPVNESEKITIYRNALLENTTLRVMLTLWR